MSALHSIDTEHDKQDSFFARLERETEQERAYLLSTPIIHDALAGKVNTETYIAFLTQAYHHVKHTVPLLMACGGQLDQDHEWLRKSVAEYIEEELGHEVWILDDIDEAGGDAEAVRASVPDISTAAMVSYAYDVIHRKNPVGFFGMVFVLEGTSINIGPKVAECLKGTLDVPNKAYTYLDTHGSLDLKHMDFFREQMNELTDPDDQEAVISTAKAMFQLYANIFRSLSRVGELRH